MQMWVTLCNWLLPQNCKFRPFCYQFYEFEMLNMRILFTMQAQSRLAVPCRRESMDHPRSWYSALRKERLTGAWHVLLLRCTELETSAQRISTWCFEIRQMSESKCHEPKRAACININKQNSKPIFFVYYITHSNINESHHEQPENNIWINQDQ